MYLSENMPNNLSMYLSIYLPVSALQWLPPATRTSSHWGSQNLASKIEIQKLIDLNF